MIIRTIARSFVALAFVLSPILLAQPKRRQPPPKRPGGPHWRDARNLVYSVPQPILSGQSESWLTKQVADFTRVPALHRHRRQVPRILSLSLAVRALPEAQRAEWRARLFAPKTPADTVFAVFTELLDGKFDNLMQLQSTVADENVGTGWRILASALHKVQADAPSLRIADQAIGALYLVGIPSGGMPGKNKTVPHIKVVLAYIEALPEDMQKALAAAVVKGKTAPASARFVKLLRSSLGKFVEYRICKSIHLARLHVELMDTPRKKIRAAQKLTRYLPELAELVEEKREAAKKEALAGGLDPEAACDMARLMSRKGELPAACTLYLRAENAVHPTRRSSVRLSLFHLLKRAERSKDDAGTTLAEQLRKRQEAVGKKPTAANRMSLADLLDFNGEKQKALAMYEVVARDDAASVSERLVALKWVAERNSPLVRKLLSVLRKPLVEVVENRLQDSGDSYVIRALVAEGHFIEAADLLAELRPTRCNRVSPEGKVTAVVKDWKIGDEAAYRVLGGQSEQAGKLLENVRMESDFVARLSAFIRLASPVSIAAYFPDTEVGVQAKSRLGKAATDGPAWPIATRCALDRIPRFFSASHAADLWKTLVAHVPSKLDDADRQLPNQLAEAVVALRKQKSPKGPKMFLMLLGSASGPFYRNTNRNDIVPHCIQMVRLCLEESVACEPPDKDVKMRLEGFVKACRHVQATPDQFQALRAGKRKVQAI
ncbi:MAG: hypothetical protein KAI66_06810, partial [Lentisphaeria bacterium]|nr:hypothetical protein [Lentisphaeria bacterium]